MELEVIVSCLYHPAPRLRKITDSLIFFSLNI